jgi:hypothetical protein
MPLAAAAAAALLLLTGASVSAQQVPSQQACLDRFNSLGGQNALIAQLAPCQGQGARGAQCCANVSLARPLARCVLAPHCHAVSRVTPPPSQQNVAH